MGFFKIGRFFFSLYPVLKRATVKPGSKYDDLIGALYDPVHVYLKWDVGS